MNKKILTNLIETYRTEKFFRGTISVNFAPVQATTRKLNVKWSAEIAKDGKY